MKSLVFLVSLALAPFLHAETLPMTVTMNPNQTATISFTLPQGSVAKARVAWTLHNKKNPNNPVSAKQWLQRVIQESLRREWVKTYREASQAISMTTTSILESVEALPEVVPAELGVIEP